MWIFLISFPKWHEKNTSRWIKSFVTKWSKKFKVERILTRFGLMNVVKSSLWIQEVKERRERERKREEEEREDRIEKSEIVILATDALLLPSVLLGRKKRQFKFNNDSSSLSPSFIQVSVWWTRDEKGRKKSSSSLFYSLFQHQLQYICREEEGRSVKTNTSNCQKFLSLSFNPLSNLSFTETGRHLSSLFSRPLFFLVLSFSSSFPVDIFLPTQSQQLEKKLTASSSWTKKKPFVLASLRN